MSIKQTTLFDDEPVKAEHTKDSIKAPFPYFGGKSGVASLIWYAFGEVKQYIEPFCGSAAVLLGNPKPASLEVAGDVNCYIANFWRAVKYQPDAVAEQADYPVSHIDLAARHRWLVEPERTADLAANLADPEWPGDAQVAGWWCWGQCAWIGSGWCDSGGQSAKIPHVGDAGRGVQSGSIRRPFRSRDAVRGGASNGKIPLVGNAGRGLQRGRFPTSGTVGEEFREREREREIERTQVPHLSSAGQGINRGGSFDGADLRDWMHELSARLKRVRLIHGSWDRCMNMHYGDKGKNAAVFFDPPYVAYERLYGKQAPVALAVAEWCKENAETKIALCGHIGDYELPGWQVLQWDRGRLTYGGGETTAKEAIWFSPACRRVK